MLYPQKYILVLISVRSGVNLSAMMRLEGLGKLKIFKDLIGNRTHDLLAYSIMPQPTTLQVPQENLFPKTATN
jgi:hypothetical protein